MTRDDSAKLRWWFWFLLFMPSLSCAAGTALVNSQLAGMRVIGFLYMVGLATGGFLNLVCSSLAAVHFVNTRTTDAYQQRGTLGWGFLFFVTNVFLCFGGCTLGGKIGKAFYQ